MHFQEQVKLQQQICANLRQELQMKNEVISNLESSLERIKVETPDSANVLAMIESEKVAASIAVSQNQELKSQLSEIQNAFVHLVFLKMSYYTKHHLTIIYFQFSRVTTN